MRPAADKLELTDVRGADIVDIQISEDGKRIWVNCNGICVFRSYDTQRVQLDWLGVCAAAMGKE